MVLSNGLCEVFLCAISGLHFTLRIGIEESMTRTIFLMILVGCAPLVASADNAAGRVTMGTPLTQRVTQARGAEEVVEDIVMEPDFREWADLRVENAQQGRAEIVRFPMGVRGPWGCSCPREYMGQFTESAGGPFIRPIPPPGRELSDPGQFGYIVIVEGMFTGNRIEESHGQGGEVEYSLPEFQILRMRSLRGDDDTLATVLLSAEQSADEAVPFADDQPWLVLIDSVNRRSRDAAERADELVQRLISGGFSGAEFFDSRRALNLYCCFYTVVAGRYSTQDEATSVAEIVREAGFEVSVRRGW